MTAMTPTTTFRFAAGQDARPAPTSVSDADGCILGLNRALEGRRLR
jgi:hypothetical protein